MINGGFLILKITNSSKRDKEFNQSESFCLDCDRVFWGGVVIRDGIRVIRWRYWTYAVASGDEKALICAVWKRVEANEQTVSTLDIIRRQHSQGVRTIFGAVIAVSTRTFLWIPKSAKEEWNDNFEMNPCNVYSVFNLFFEVTFIIYVFWRAKQ